MHHHSFSFSTGIQSTDMAQFTTDSRQPELLIKMPTLENLKKELRYATEYLSAHKLYHSSKWYFK